MNTSVKHHNMFGLAPLHLVSQIFNHTEVPHLQATLANKSWLQKLAQNKP